MANDVCRARSLHGVMNVPEIAKIISRNSCKVSDRRRLFSDKAYAIEEYKWESRWKTQLVPSVSRASLPVSFWASDTLKQRRCGCQVESSRFNTSVRYLIGINTVSQMVSIIEPRTVCRGLMTYSLHLSIAKGHWRTCSSGSPITTNIASIIATSTIFM